MEESISKYQIKETVNNKSISGPMWPRSPFPKEDSVSGPMWPSTMYTLKLRIQPFQFRSSVIRRKLPIDLGLSIVSINIPCRHFSL